MLKFTGLAGVMILYKSRVKINFMAGELILPATEKLRVQRFQRFHIMLAKICTTCSKIYTVSTRRRSILNTNNAMHICFWIKVYDFQKDFDGAATWLLIRQYTFQNRLVAENRDCWSIAPNLAPSHDEFLLLKIIWFSWCFLRTTAAAFDGIGAAVILLAPVVSVAVWTV